MTVTLNDEAIRRLLALPPQKVALEMERVGHAIAVEAQNGVDKIMWRSPIRPQVVAEMTRDETGPVVKVHLDHQGRQSDYLDAKEAREHSWLLPALEAVRS